MPQICLQNTFLHQASPGQGGLAFALIERRISWMEQHGIEQWPRAHYLGVFNQDYFERAAGQGQLWLLRDSKAVLACAVVLEQDERWKGKDSAPAYYVHNLASLPQYPGAGGRLLVLLEEKALRDGKRFLRLDCKTGARKINAYYRRRGYQFAGYFRSEPYNGNLRQKPLAGTTPKRAEN